MKKALLTIINVISILIIGFSLMILLTVIMTSSNRAPSFMGFSLFRVITGSMEPTLPVDSLIVVRRTDAEQVRNGDVITFYSNDPTLNGAINTHRVASIEWEHGDLLFITRGDANPIDDPYPVYRQDLIGIMVFS